MAYSSDLEYRKAFLNQREEEQADPGLSQMVICNPCGEETNPWLYLGVAVGGWVANAILGVVVAKIGPILMRKFLSTKGKLSYYFIT